MLISPDAQSPIIACRGFGFAISSLSFSRFLLRFSPPPPLRRYFQRAAPADAPAIFIRSSADYGAHAATPRLSRQRVLQGGIQREPWRAAASVQHRLTPTAVTHTGLREE